SFSARTSSITSHIRPACPKTRGRPLYANGSTNAQMPVEAQLAIFLFRFGHSGNVTGLHKVANWAGVGKGAITVVTVAILRPDFMSEFVRTPTATEKEKAKAWVQSHSCK
ncbi:hypothetical protein K438DRAFT_2086887, partial [Mycena galopus ATCC 62051]